MKHYLAILYLIVTFNCTAQMLEKEHIKEVMSMQEKCWNNGDVDCFMQGYWRSDSLKFIGSKGLTFGWQQTLANYKKSYPDKATMGHLEFNVLSLDLLSETDAVMIGKWNLTREIGNIGGHFTLIWKKIDEKWVIVADHTS